MHAAGVGHAPREAPRFRAAGDETEPVAEPLHRRPGDEHAALERVRALTPGSARGGRQQPGGAAGR